MARDAVWRGHAPCYLILCVVRCKVQSDLGAHLGKKLMISVFRIVNTPLLSAFYRSQKLHLGWQDAGGPSEVSSARCVTAPSQRTPFAGLRGTHAAHALSSMHPPCPGALLRRAAAPLSFKATPVAFADARDTSGFRCRLRCLSFSRLPPNPAPPFRRAPPVPACRVLSLCARARITDTMCECAQPRLRDCAARAVGGD